MFQAFYVETVMWHNKTMKVVKKTAQERQDDIFRKMSASRKVKLTSDLALFCLKLNSLNGNNKSKTTFSRNS